jgi:hypothetical protein
MTPIHTMQPPAAMPTAAPVVSVMSGLAGGRDWQDIQVATYRGGNDGTHGFTAKRSPRLLGRPST